MTRVIEWLLGLQDIRLGDGAPLFMKWPGALPAWILALLAATAVAIVVLAYRRERASVGRRIGLAGIRLALIGLVLVVLCRPTLVLQRNRVERSYVSVAVDTSMSMATREPYADESLSATVARGARLEDPAALPDLSRLELVKTALAGESGNPFRALLEHNGVQLATFAGTLETRAWAASGDALDPLLAQLDEVNAQGANTDLAGAITRVIGESRGRRLAAIVLASDGQSTEPTSLKDALNLARGHQVPVFPVRIGSPQKRCDVVVGPVRADGSVFVKDFLAVEAQVSATGLEGPTPINVQLVDDQAEQVVASRQVTLGPTADTATVELTTKPLRVGQLGYRVEALPIRGEYGTDNNVDRLEVRVLDDRLRVLYVDGYPRYEYRYLKNALIREETVELSVLLIEADERFVQEGTEPIRRFPNTPEELNRYDVVLFGDVNPRGGWLSGAQMRMLLDFVGNHGGGFGLIAGERTAPHHFLETPLEKLIPAHIDPSFLGHYDRALTSGFRPQLSAEGRRSPVFRLDLAGRQAADGDEQTRDRLFSSLPELFWIARTLGPKPGATVLAYHPTLPVVSDRPGAGERMPLVVIGRYGAGRIFFQATDDTWRWRRHTGELLHDTYWVQVVRALMRDDRVAQGRRFAIRPDRRVYAYGVPVHVQVEVFDSELLSVTPETVELTVVGRSDRPAGASSAEPPRETDLPFVAAHFSVHRLGPKSNLFEGTYLPPYPGGFTFEAEGLDSPRTEAAAPVSIRVEQPDLEARRPEADHDVLQRIADATGGKVIELDELATTLGTIRDRNMRIPDDITEPLWDSKLVLILFVILLSMEWILRKAFGLL